MKQPSFAEFLSWFPCFRDRGIETIDQVNALLDSPAATSGSAAACRFAQSVWNCYSTRFSLGDLTCWDAEYMEAFKRWARDPFFY